MKPLYNYDFTLKLSGTGETHADAWDSTICSLMDDVHAGHTPVPDTSTRYKDPVAAVIHLECDVCGKEEDVRDDDMGEWMPEVYLGEVHLGCVCPDCQLRYCELSDDGLPEILLHKVDFSNHQCRPLVSAIMNIINHGEAHLGTKKTDKGNS